MRLRRGEPCARREIRFVAANAICQGAAVHLRRMQMRCALFGHRNLLQPVPSCGGASGECLQLNSPPSQFLLRGVKALMDVFHPIDELNRRSRHCTARFIRRAETETSKSFTSARELATAYGTPTSPARAKGRRRGDAGTGGGSARFRAAVSGPCARPFERQAPSHAGSPPRAPGSPHPVCRS